MSDQDSGSRTANLILSTQLIILGLVFHMWMDMMGNFEAGGNITSLFIAAALLVLIAPDVEAAYMKIKRYYES